MKKTSSKALIITLILLLMLPTALAFAGNKNQNTEENGKSVERGTGKTNGLDGCRPGTMAPNVWIFIPSDLPPGWSHTWQGALCCAARSLGIHDYFENEPVYYPNQCCNPPDTEGGVPGNHCLCFMNRGYPIPNALPLT
jgi:hypothetical protein